MSEVKRAREEAEAPGAEVAAVAAPPPFASLTQDDVLLVLGIVAQTLVQRMRTVDADVAAARVASAAWAARPPRPDDDEGCLARARRSAQLAAEHAERKATEVPQLPHIISTRVTGLCRDTWRCVPAGLSAADAERVRAGHPLWRAIIDLPHGGMKWTRLMHAVIFNKLPRLHSLCDWHAGLEVRDACGRTALHHASSCGHTGCARELITRGADVNAATNNGITPLMLASWRGRIDAVRLLLIAGADKRRVDAEGRTAHSEAGGYRGDNTAAIRALLDAAP